MCGSAYRIGGKTGVDFKGYKNMVGAFKMPRLVYMNIHTLTTLDERQFYAGFAEAMKSALIRDVHYYEWQIENLYEICSFLMHITPAGHFGAFVVFTLPRKSKTHHR